MKSRKIIINDQSWELYSAHGFILAARLVGDDSYILRKELRSMISQLKGLPSEVAASEATSDVQMKKAGYYRAGENCWVLHNVPMFPPAWFNKM
jgi:hypothetical protein